MGFKLPQSNQTATLKIVVLGAILMVAIDFTFFDGFNHFQKARDARAIKSKVNSRILYGSETEDALYAARKIDDAAFEDITLNGLPHTDVPSDSLVSMPQVPVEDQLDAWREQAIRNSVDEIVEAALVAKPPIPTRKEKVIAKKYAPEEPVPVFTGKTGKVVIIIDDLGMARENTYKTMNLPAPLTLAFLPYAPKLSVTTSEAKAKGHELLIHVPMEPMKRGLSPGPMALLNKMSEADLRHNLDLAFDSFEGYVGINNHMGSRVTQNPEVMGWVMEELAKRDLLFVDSKTISTSVAADEAREHGLRYAERDVFLDHEDDYAFVMKALGQLERVARRKGVAIAIGHPKANTIRALQEWLPTLASKNLELVAVSDVVKRQAPSIPVSVVKPSQLHEIEPATY